MYPCLNEQIAAQRRAELRAQAARQAGRRQARQVRQASPASRGASSRLEESSHGASLRADRHRRSHPVRRRAGYALISIGLRLAYAAGDD